MKVDLHPRLFLDITLDNPAANLALDEALLESADSAWAAISNQAPANAETERAPEGKGRERLDFPRLELLRLWEPRQPFVVLGRSSPYEHEVNQEFCRRYQIPVLRRCSGGATILTGPGCLMYAVVLHYANDPDLKKLDLAHRFVMTQMRQALTRLKIEADIQGTSDLTLGNRKFSGNSLRCRRYSLLYHGTFICNLDLELVAECLRFPSRQPDYRASRTHADFLTQLPVSTAELSQAIIEQWAAKKQIFDWPSDLTQQLVLEKYDTRKWTEQLN